MGNPRVKDGLRFPQMANRMQLLPRLCAPRRGGGSAMPENQTRATCGNWEVATSSKQAASQPATCNLQLLEVALRF